MDEVGHDPLVKVLPTQVRVPAGGEDFVVRVLNTDQGRVKRATTEVKHKHVLLGAGLAEAERKSRLAYSTTEVGEGWDVVRATARSNKDHTSCW